MSAIVGELALEFSLPDTDAHLRWLSEFHRLGPVVLLFLPSAYGWRPRWQLWSLLRHYDSFVEMATEVVVATPDPLPELRIFHIRRGFPFVFLSDREGTVARSYDVPPGCAGTFVITTKGFIRLHRVVDGMGLRSSGSSLLRILHRLDERDRRPARAS